jgi:transposase
MKALSLDLKQRIADAIETGATRHAIADRFAVSVPTVNRIARKKRRGQELKAGQSTGRNPSIAEDQWKDFEELVRSKQDWSATTLTLAWIEKTGINLSVSTTTRALRKIGFVFKKSPRLHWSEIKPNETSSGSK